MKDLISYSDFTKIEIRLGTIISAELNNKLRKPSYVLKIDFGDEIGVKKSSAQLTKNYNNNVLKYSTKNSIRPSNWNKVTCRVKQQSSNSLLINCVW